MVGCVVGPGAVVACGGDDGHAALLDPVHDGGVAVVIGGTGGGGAQGQVDGVGTQEHGVLDGGQDIGVEGTAVLAEDLHHEKLGIGSGTCHEDLAQSVHILAVLLNVAVGCGDTGHVGAVFTLVIVVVGDIQVTVHVVEAVGGLCIEIQIVGGQGRARSLQLSVGVQLGQDIGHIRGIHQAVGLAGLLQGIAESLGIEGLMIGVQAGVDDGDPGACAGISGEPGLVGAGHLAGDSHIRGVGAADADHVGGVAALLDHGLDTVELADLGDGPAGHIDGDQVGCQGQVPDHIQLLAG